MGQRRGEEARFGERGLGEAPPLLMDNAGTTENSTKPFIYLTINIVEKTKSAKNQTCCLPY
jgi:hypothetical protein